MNSQKSLQSSVFLIAVCLAFVAVQLDISIVNVGLESLKQAYNANITDLEWIINAYSLFFAAFLLSTSALSNRYGVKNIFIIGIVIFITASLSCALATSLLWLNISRCIQGIGAALMVPSSMTLIQLYYPNQRQRAFAIAMWAASGSFALAAGPVIGGLLIKLFGWQSIFIINLPIGILSIVIIAMYAPASLNLLQKINYFGQFLVILALGLFTFSLTESGRYGWSSLVTLLTMVGAIIFFITYMLNERRTAIPVLDRTVIKNSIIITAVSIGFICNLVFYGAVFIFSIFFQNELHLSPLATGLSFLPMMVFTAVVNFSSNWLNKYVKLRSLSILGSLVSFCGFALLLFMTPNWGAYQLFIPMMLLGGGTSLAMPGMANLIFSQASKEGASSASALFSCARQMGGVIGVGIFGLMITNNSLFNGVKLVVISAMLFTAIWLVVSVFKLTNSK